MKKTIRKLFIFWYFLVLMSFCVYSSTVSDNDGSAFISKAEFDSLKSTFQKQIDTYNNSIDAKIDDAISSYLSGLSFNKTINSSVLLNKISAINVSDASFCDLSSVSVSTNNNYGVAGCCSWEFASQTAPDCFFANSMEWGPSFILCTGDYSHTNGNVANYKHMIYTKEKQFKFNNQLYFYLIDNYTEKGIHNLCSYGMSCYWAGTNRSGYFPASYTVDLTGFQRPGNESYNFTNFVQTVNGQIFHEYIYENDTKYDSILYNACSSVKSNDIYTINYDKLSDFDDITKDATPDSHQVIYAPSSSDQAVTNNIQNYNGGREYAGSSGPSSSGSTTSIRKGDIYFYFKYYRQKRYKHNQTEWVNYSAYQTINKPVYKYQGVPLVSISKKGILKFKLDFTGFTVTTGGSNKPTKFTVAISNQPFSNNLISAEPEVGRDYSDGLGMRKEGIVYIKKNIDISTGSASLDDKIEIKEFDGTDSKILYVKVEPDREGISVISPENFYEYKITE